MTQIIDVDKPGIPLLDQKSSVNAFQIWDAIESKSGKPRLREARTYFQDLKQGDILELVEVFKCWRDFDEFLILKGENKRTGEKEGLAVKCSKRGNDVYGRRFDKKLGFLKKYDLEFFKPEDLSTEKKIYSSILWVTLTFDSKLCSLKEAWEGQIIKNFIPEKKGGIQVYFKGKIGRQLLKQKKSCNCLMCSFNRFITNLRNKYGKITYLSFPQAFPGQKGKAFGYPHMHVVMMFEEAKFEVFPNLEEENDGSFSMRYRIKEKKEVKKQGNYHSFIDIQAFRTSRGIYNYAKKYAQNVAYGDSYEANLNNSLLWLYKKKGFNLSSSFRAIYSEFINSLQYSNRFFQKNLFGGIVPGVVSDWKYSLVGIRSFSELCRVKKDMVMGVRVPWFVKMSIDEVNNLWKKG